MSGTYLSVVNDVTNCNYIAKVKTNDGSGCKIRIGPSINLELITTLLEGTEVRVIDKGRYNNIDGYDWCRIQLSDGRQAFMPIKYLK
ncbi:MAG: SH3 domain-containing protein [Clostridia bacterium]